MESSVAMALMLLELSWRKSIIFSVHRLTWCVPGAGRIVVVLGSLIGEETKDEEIETMALKRTQGKPHALT
jgi:hypothetical protein